MAKSYQLVAWTEKGRVKMIPSEFNAFINEEMKHLDQLGERVRYGTDYEIRDLLMLSGGYEKVAFRLLNMGRVSDAFLLFAQAAFCCTASENNWVETEWGEMLCKPLRRRFFAMVRECEDLVLKYPKLQLLWEECGLGGEEKDC